MAGTGSPLPTSGKRTVDFALNLVPFLDLLSVLISFLLLTSAWTTVAKLSAAAPRDEQKSGGDAPVDALNLRLDVTPAALLLWRRGAVEVQIPRTDPEHAILALDGALQGLRARDPDNRALEVRAADGVAYDEVIQALDVALARGLTELSVSGLE